MTMLLGTPQAPYCEAIGRNVGEEKGHSHLYYVDKRGNYWPLCMYGWNRSDGERFSIFRGHRGDKGLCKLCAKARDAGSKGLRKPVPHKTKWL